MLVTVGRWRVKSVPMYIIRACACCVYTYFLFYLLRARHDESSVFVIIIYT